MTRLDWDKTSLRQYETGVDRGVFYPQGGFGEVWNGLISVQESPSDVDAQPRYIDGVKIGNRGRLGEFAGTIEAFTYPDSFYQSVLLQRRPKFFGMSYRVETGDSHKIHLVYKALLAPASREYVQRDSSIFSWEFTTRPQFIDGRQATAHLIIDTAVAYTETVAEIEEFLYGSDTEMARLPTPEELLGIFERNARLKVVDNGDGTFTVTGPDEAIQMLDPTTFQITWPSAVYIDPESYTISSL
jgi:hypothetical protein